MSETTNDTRPPADDRTADEIEADIAETRDRLAESVDALAAKVDVKAQAKEKVGEAKAQAKEKVDEATAGPRTRPVRPKSRSSSLRGAWWTASRRRHVRFRSRSALRRWPC